MTDKNRSALLGSHALRVALVMSCLFGTTGCMIVFLPRWLEVERDLGGVQIGLILSLAQFARIGTGPLVALWADGAADRRTPIQILACASTAAFACFFFFARDFVSLLVLALVALTLLQSITPLLEAAALRATSAGRLGYGVARGIGSLAFIAGNVAGGALVARFGLDALVVWVTVGLVFTAAAALGGLKPDPVPEHVRKPDRRARLSETKQLLRSRRLVILLVSCGLIQSAHGFYYNFSVLVWRGQGVPADTVGLLWACGVAVEVAFLLFLSPVERRVSPEAMILAGAAGGAVRWLLLGFAPLGMVLWPLQALHTLSFAAAHVGAMRLLYREAPESSAAMAQTLYAVMTGGLLMGASTLLSGALYDAVGARGYWAMSALSAAGGALALLLLRPAPRVSATSL